MSAHAKFNPEGKSRAEIEAIRARIRLSNRLAQQRRRANMNDHANAKGPTTTADRLAPPGKPPTSEGPSRARGKLRRGFAAMDPAMQREIAAKGGRVAHAQGVAHEFTTEEAIAAGRKGGNAVHQKHGYEHMSQIGQLGGERRAQNERARRGDG